MADATAVHTQVAGGAPAAAATSDKPAEAPAPPRDGPQPGQAAAPAPDAPWVDPGACRERNRATARRRSGALLSHSHILLVH
jgi:hypothetical protein